MSRIFIVRLHGAGREGGRGTEGQEGGREGGRTFVMQRHMHATQSTAHSDSACPARARWARDGTREGGRCAAPKWNVLFPITAWARVTSQLA